MFTVEVHSGVLQWRCTLEVQSEGAQLGGRVEVYNGSVQWMFTVKVHSGGAQ